MLNIYLKIFGYIFCLVIGLKSFLDKMRQNENKKLSQSKRNLEKAKINNLISKKVLINTYGKKLLSLATKLDALSNKAEFANFIENETFEDELEDLEDELEDLEDELEDLEDELEDLEDELEDLEDELENLNDKKFSKKFSSFSKKIKNFESKLYNFNDKIDKKITIKINNEN